MKFDLLTVAEELDALRRRLEEVALAGPFDPALSLQLDRAIDAEEHLREALIRVQRAIGGNAA